jgi:Na+/melibiose symporter-like transporter/HEAT repeat protein
MSSALSPYRLGKARDLYNIFNVFNALSWQFLVGNIITLFALRLGANSTYIGLINAMLYVAFFFLPVGKILTNRFPIVKVFAAGWIGRAIGMAPLLFVPAAVAGGRHETALWLTILGVALFHIGRGIGMIGNNPVLSHLASGPDRGSYMTQIQIINSAIGMFAGFIIAVILGRAPPLFLYSIIMAVGIGCGIFSGLLMTKIPGPEVEKDSAKIKIFDTIKEALSQTSLRRFIVILLMVALVSGVSRAFLIVYSREVFNQSDGMVSLYAVFGGFGNLMIGLLIKFLVDRIGAKPIFSLCVLIALVSMVPVLFVPLGIADNFTTVTLYLTLLFFLMNFGWLGSEGIMQTYFLGLIPVEKMMDMGIVYFFGFGIAGAGGSFLGGLLLDLVSGLSSSPLLAFKILYSILIGVSIVILILMRKLVPLGALPFWGAMEVMFSFRNLKAISLLDKLNKTSDSQEEAALLEALHDTPSKLALRGLLARARSPRLQVRLESFRAIDALDTLDEATERALMDDIINNPYTTACNSARILGSHGVFSAIPLLRELAVSKDYMLAGEAIIALAKLGDNAFRPQIERIIGKTKNPRLKIMGVEAFGIYGSPNSLTVLLDILRGANPPPYLRDEVVLAMAGILDVQNQFYPLLVRFLEDESLAPTLALDEAEWAYESYVSVFGRKRIKKDTDLAVLSRQARLLQPAVSDYVKNSDGGQLSRWILELPDDQVHTVVQVVISEAVLDDELISHRRLRLLIAHWAAHQLWIWTNRLKV